jgi:calreticulin
MPFYPVRVHPEIANPEYVEDNEIYKYDSNAYVGFDLWQVKSGSVFDNIIVTDDILEAEALMKETFTAHQVLTLWQSHK